MMNFVETRGNETKHPPKVSFSEAILSPMSSFGGIYAPEFLPDLGLDFLKQHVNSDYKTLARDVLATFAIDIDLAVINKALDLYEKFDDPNDPAPLVQVKSDLYISELYHGVTRAFKDMALQPFGVVLSALAQQRHENYLVMVATSGDTGPAALETFKHRENVQVVCLYPVGGTSDVQRLQMVTMDADNLKVIGIHGSFDDAQNALKTLLSSDTFNAKLKQHNIYLSAANSVNFGRIIFQLIYHLYSYLALVRLGKITVGDKVYLDVPSGNFGNALGGYYAKKMGLPVEKILIASNRNNVLTHLITTGTYNLQNASVVATTSPAMDILKSSNIERILYDLYGAKRTKNLMLQLDTEKYYQLTKNELKQLQQIFSADFCDDEEGQQYIKTAFESPAAYLMDPHTATCFKTYDTCRTKQLPTIAYSTAEWTKFSPTIAQTLTGKTGSSDIEALQAIAKKANINIPTQISDLFNKEITQTSVINKVNIEKEILAFLS